MRPGSLSLDAFLSRRASDRRLARLTHDISLPAGRGLEFGPADNPTPLPEGLRITYVDRDLNAGVCLPEAAPIDCAWDNSGTLVDGLGRGGYDFAIAAQVGHFVPDLLGWLRGIHATLRPGGVLNLSLPDKRFTCDAARPVSTLAELVEAELLGLTQPSPRQVFAHAHEVRSVTPERIWDGEDPVLAPRMAGDAALAHAFAEAVRVQSGTYVPSHCWVVTPRSFLNLVAGATRLGLLSFVMNRVSGVEPGGFEFYVSMRRDLETDPVALRRLQEVGIDHLRSDLERRRVTAALLGQDAT